MVTGQLVAMVVYGQLLSPRSLHLLLRCPRCEGSTCDRTDSRRRCPLCTGTPTPGRHAAGWAYLVPADLDGGPPEPGDVVELPSTPYTSGNLARGVVVEVREQGSALARKSVLRVIERRGWVELLTREAKA
jgi:hypothetical protein